MSQNPYESPRTSTGAEIEVSAARLDSVARAFVLIGWFGIVLYTPIVVTCFGALWLTLAGRRVGSALGLACALAFNGAVLALAVFYVLTGRRLSKRDLAVRRRAVVLSCLLMIGFPFFTLVGVICYRYIKLYFHDTAPGSADLDWQRERLADVHDRQ